ncbi:MAG: sodium/glucose cotransporter, partial [Akkermansiaceae bacterium]|nr:sodium/glucose cotransporter [Akkermansiaceae bacterium]
VGNAPIVYDYDAAFPTLLRNLMRPGITWFVLAAIFGAVVSALASMLSSAATVASIDLFGKLRPEASEKALITAGRAFTVLFVLISILTATVLAERIGSVFSFIQEIQGFISPGVLAVFLFGFLSPKTPRYFGWLGIAVNAVLYGGIKWAIGPALCKAGLWFAPEISYVDRMGICFIAILLLGAFVTWKSPLASPVRMPVTDVIALDSSKGAKVMAAIAVVLTVGLYVIFW